MAKAVIDLKKEENHSLGHIYEFYIGLFIVAEGFGKGYHKQ